MNRITEFVDSFIPKNLPKKRKEALKEELKCHLLDKTEYYKEIGYDESESISKAIKDFGTDEDMKNFIFGEFEELYSEKAIVGILAGLSLFVMNFLCFPLDIWMYTADMHQTPNPHGTFISFTMIFFNLFLVIFARVKKYRKMLFFVGLANIIMLAAILVFVYPQMAINATEYNIIYLIDRFTPISMWNVMKGYSLYSFGFLSIILTIVYPIIVAGYCFIESYRLKRGKARTISRPVLKISVFAAVFFTAALFSSVLQEPAERYVEECPVWFRDFNNYICEDTEAIYSEIALGDSLEEVTNVLYEKGFMPIDAYRNSLDKWTKKQFDANLKLFDFMDGYTVWFLPEAKNRGHGFVGIKAENGVLSGKAVGNVNEDMYNEKDKSFGYVKSDVNADMSELFEFFGSLKKGDREEYVLSRFASQFGIFYTKRESLENGIPESYYRILCYGESISDGKDYYEEYDRRYIEVMFEDGDLTKGVMYKRHDALIDLPITAEYVK